MDRNHIGIVLVRQRYGFINSPERRIDFLGYRQTPFEPTGPFVISHPGGKDPALRRIAKISNAHINIANVVNQAYHIQEVAKPFSSGNLGNLLGGGSDELVDLPLVPLGRMQPEHVYVLVSVVGEFRIWYVSLFDR